MLHILGRKIAFNYTNWKGEHSNRVAKITSVMWGSNEWHPVPQLLLGGYDFDKHAQRTYAAKDMSNVVDLVPDTPMPY